MGSYKTFALFYDALTENIDYHCRAAYFDSIIQKYGNGGNLLLDLACGTGSLSIEMENLGYDVIGVDGSVQMLNIAMSKQNENIIFLRQQMHNLDMYGTMDVVICALDSINHEVDEKKVQKTFDKVSLFLNDGGLFIFDVNSKFKHEHILSDNTFIYDTENVYCIWQNKYNKRNNQTSINLDFFHTSDDKNYIRSEESFCERFYSSSEIDDFIKKSQLEVLDIYEGDTFDSPKDDTQRIVYVTKKIRD